MKNLNIYITEGLADWGEDNTLNKKMSKQTTKAAIKNEIKQWIINNAKNRIYKNQFIFDLNVTPITVDYEGDILFENYTSSLTNGIFQWGKVGGVFNCSHCKSLKTLEGAPKEVGGYFECSHCTSLKTLEGAPEKVGWSFFCKDCNSLKSLEGAPKEVGWEFDCSRCGTQFTEDDVKKVSNVKKEIYC